EPRLLADARDQRGSPGALQRSRRPLGLHRLPQAAVMPDCRLYLISPERIEHPSIFAADLRAALDGDDAAFQLRLKDVDDDTIARVADTLRPVCQQRDVAFILNDRPDLAAKLDCDGVHVGQDDLPYREAPRIVAP